MRVSNPVKEMSSPLHLTSQCGEDRFKSMYPLPFSSCVIWWNRIVFLVYLKSVYKMERGIRGLFIHVSYQIEQTDLKLLLSVTKCKVNQQ